MILNVILFVIQLPQWDLGSTVIKVINYLFLLSNVILGLYELLQILESGYTEHFKDGWNWVDVILIFL